MKYFTAIILITALHVSCTNTVTAPAVVTERKLTDEGDLKLTYAFTHEGVRRTDSARLSGKLVVADTFMVKILSGSPLKTEPQISR